MNLRNLLLFFALLYLSSIGLSTAEESKRANEDSEQQKTTTPKPSSGKRAQVKTLKEFIPSEEVSADKAVSFPSDI